MISNYLELPGVSRYLFSQEAISEIFDRVLINLHTQPAITCSKLTIETLELSVKCIQS